MLKNDMRNIGLCLQQNDIGPRMVRLNITVAGDGLEHLLSLVGKAMNKFLQGFVDRLASFAPKRLACGRSIGSPSN